MKVKGANFFELHVEKIVLAVVSLFFVLVLVMQLGTQGPTVSVDNREWALDEAYQPAEVLARSVRTRMNIPDPELPEIRDQVDLLASFHSARTASLAPRERIALGPSLSIAAGDVSDGALGNARLAELVIPAPRDPAAHTFAATIDPWVVAQNPDLAALLPSEQPYDKAAVSVQATFDSRALYQSLRSEPEGDLSAWPHRWWNNAIEIFAVRLDRQRQNSDGSWGEIETVPTPPGMVDLPAELAEIPDLTPAGLKRDVEQAQRDLGIDIRRPPFYPIIAGDPWIEPREGARLARLETGVNPEVTGLQRRLTQIDRGIAELESERAEIGQPRDGAPADRARDAQIRRIEGLLTRRRAERERVVADLAERGFAPEPPAGAQQADQQSQTGRRGQTATQSLASGEPVEVWAHDLTAEPGQTYRYRVRLELNNPAYGQTQFLVEDQQYLAEDITVSSQNSAWTDPVIVSPMTAFFVTSGSEAQVGQMGVRAATAGVEIFTFRYGFYRRGTASLEPGDHVAAWAELPEGLPLFDLERPPPPGGFDRAAEGGDMPTLGVRAHATTGAYLLDVYESAAREAGALTQGRAPRIVAFGDPSGDVQRRVVGADRRSPLYGRLSASAAAGRTQGQPEPEPEPEQGRRPPREVPLPPPPMDPGGGGGGG